MHISCCTGPCEVYAFSGEDRGVHPRLNYSNLIFRMGRRATGASCCASPIGMGLLLEFRRIVCAPVVRVPGSPKEKRVFTTQRTSEKNTSRKYFTRA